AAFYAGWYPKQWMGGIADCLLPVGDMHGTLRGHAKYAARTSRRLARTLFHAMIKHGPKLEREQMLLGRLVDIGTELFAIAATCSHAQAMLVGGKTPTADVLALADLFCRDARLRIEESFRTGCNNNDRRRYRLARDVLDGKYAWLEEGILSAPATNPSRG
ncbi:MAG: acyl-CoA dehydrogenase, partial [Verrucomicrobia bacterium]|nr:acyl-CoA dehydrogenase [Verrucomicrobiota bacterium]